MTFFLDQLSSIVGGPLVNLELEEVASIQQVKDQFPPKQKDEATEGVSSNLHQSNQAIVLRLEDYSEKR